MNPSNVLSFVLFADDTTVYVQNDSIGSAIKLQNWQNATLRNIVSNATLQNWQCKLAKVALWFDSNKLAVNVNKTQMMMLSHKKFSLQNEVILWNEVEHRVNKAKFLGVIVDQHLNWKDHILISQKN